MNRSSANCGIRGTRGQFVVPLVLVALVLLSLAFGVAIAGAETWSEPVDGPIVDGFRPPSSRFGAGNRGLEYGIEPGTRIRAVDDGVVSYSGQIGSGRHLVVSHGSGLRSTYAFITSALVVRGQKVSKGQIIAIAGPGFHLTARLGDEYVDPRLLFAGAEVEIRLSAGVDPPSAGGRPPGSSRWDWLRATGQSVNETRLSSVVIDMARGASMWFSLDCTPAGVAATGSGEGRVVIQVAGLGSSSEEGSIGKLDLVGVGYRPQDIVGFSYGGGCTPSPYGDMPTTADWIGDELTSSSYEASDTYDDLHQSARELADLVDEIGEARPGVIIDLATHSLGGVVGRLALEILADRHGGAIPIGVLLTIDSPHQGTEMATAATSVRGGGTLDSLAEASRPEGQFDSVSVRQVSEAGSMALSPPGPPPSGVSVVAVSGSTDLIVPAESSVWEGATNVIVDTGIGGAAQAHSAVPGRSEVSRELALALGGQSQRCVSLGDVLGSAVLGGAVDGVENLLGVLGGIGRWVL